MLTVTFLLIYVAHAADITRTANRSFVLDPNDYFAQNVSSVSLLVRPDYHPAISFTIDNSTAPSLTCTGRNDSICPVSYTIVSPTQLVVNAAVSPEGAGYGVAVKFAERGVALARIPIVSSVLDGLSDRVQRIANGIIQEAEEAGVEVALFAGNQLSLLIEQLRGAFSSVLDTAVTKVANSILDIIIEVGELVQRFQDNNRELMQTIGERVQLIANVLPFSSKIPFLTSIVPPFLPPTSLNYSIITAKGNFPLIGKYPPVLLLGNNATCAVLPGSTSILSASFVVNNDVLESVNTSLTFGLITGTITFPNREGFIPHMVNYTYKLLMSVLPYSPGSGIAYFSSHPQVILHVGSYFIES